MQKILIIRFSSLGDLVLTTPIYREIKSIFPDSKVHVLTSSDLGQVLENNPHIDRLIFYKRRENLRKLNKLIKKLRKERFDLIYDAHRSLRSIWIVMNLTGYGFFKRIMVWSVKKRSFKKNLYILFKLNFFKQSFSQRTHFLKPLMNHTRKVLQDHTELFPHKNTTIFIKSILKKNGLSSKKFIAIGASASYSLKCWPVSHFFELIDGLLKKEWPVVLVGGENDVETRKIEKRFFGKLHNFVGKFSSLESAELLKQAFMTVTNDTSICHLSEAMGTPALVFFGPTVKEFGYEPFLKDSRMLQSIEELKCRPCSKDGRGQCRNTSYLKCLSTISPKIVLPLIPNPISILKKNNPKKI